MLEFRVKDSYAKRKKFLFICFNFLLDFFLKIQFSYLKFRECYKNKKLKETNMFNGGKWNKYKILNNKNVNFVLACKNK